MLLSSIELAAFELSSAWGKSFDVQTDQGESILSPDLRRLMEALHEVVKEKKKELSTLQSKRILKSKGEGRKLGRPVVILPMDEIKRRLDRVVGRRERAQKILAIAKEFGVHRITIARKLVEVEKEILKKCRGG